MCVDDLCVRLVEEGDTTGGNSVFRPVIEMMACFDFITSFMPVERSSKNAYLDVSFILVMIFCS